MCMDIECDLNSVNAYLSLTNSLRRRDSACVSAYLSLTVVNDKYALNTEFDLDSVSAYLSLIAVNDKYAWTVSVI